MYLARVGDGEPGTSRRLRQSSFEEISERLLSLCNTVMYMGGGKILVTTDVRCKKASKIAQCLSSTPFKASTHCILDLAERSGFDNVLLWRVSGSAHTSNATARIEQIYCQLSTFQGCKFRLNVQMVQLLRFNKVECLNQALNDLSELLTMYTTNNLY